MGPRKIVQKMAAQMMDNQIIQYQKNLPKIQRRLELRTDRLIQLIDRMREKKSIVRQIYGGEISKALREMIESVRTALRELQDIRRTVKAYTETAGSMSGLNVAQRRMTEIDAVKRQTKDAFTRLVNLLEKAPLIGHSNSDGTVTIGNDIVIAKDNYVSKEEAVEYEVDDLLDLLVDDVQSDSEDPYDLRF